MYSGSKSALEERKQYTILNKAIVHSNMHDFYMNGEWKRKHYDKTIIKVTHIL